MADAPRPPLLSRLASQFVTRLDAVPRADAGVTTVHGSTSGNSGAAILNALSGLGGARDSGSIARPNVARDYLSEDELVAMLRSSVYRRICELKPRWATIKGFTVSDDTDDPRPLQAAMRRIKLRDAVRRADTWGRVLGESRILLVTDDPGRLDQPLDPKRVRRLIRLEVFDRREFTAVEFEGDVSRGPLGDPVLYELHPNRATVGAGGRVHASRMLRFYGDALPPSEVGFNVWGWGADAVGQTLWDGIRNMLGTSASGARIAQELSIPVYKLQNGATARAGGDRDSVIGTMGLINIMKSVGGMMILGPQDSFERVSANPSGYRDIAETARTDLAALADTPAVLLYGDTPSGLNTDGQSWITAWHASVGAHREERYRDPVEAILEILYWSEQGAVPDEWSLEFPPLGDISEKERAEIRLLTVQADTVEQLDGVLTTEERRGRYQGGGGFAFDLQPVEESAAAAPTVDPQREAEVEAMVRQIMAERAGQPPAKPAAPDGTPRGDAMEGAVWIGAYLPEPSRVAWSTARAAVEAAIGPMEDPGDAPHVTVLYMGAVAPEALDEVVELARSVVERHTPQEAEAERARTFAPSAGSDGKWPVVLDVGGAWGLCWIHEQLLRRLAHLVTARQHPTYHAHMTLGYAVNLTPEQQKAIGELELEEMEWLIGGLEVRYGSKTIATLPLAGREDARADAEREGFRSEQFKIPAGARGNAAKVLAWREEHGDEVAGMTETGWRRARQLATEDTVSGQDLIEMAAWFARHGAQAETRAVAEEYKGEPWKDAGWVSWLGWGGDTARTWATSTVEKARSST